MARKKTDEEKEYDVLLANVREMLKTRSGKDIIWHILSMCNIYTESFTGNSHTFFNEGKRSVGLSILQLLEDADATTYPRLLLDKQKQQESRHVRRNSSGGTDTITDNGADT